MLDILHYTKVSPKLKNKSTRVFLISFAATFAVVAMLLILFVEIINVNYKDKILPNVWVGGINIGNKTVVEANQLLNQYLVSGSDSVKLVSSLDPSASFEIPYSQINFSFDNASTSQSAFEQGKGSGRVNTVANFFKNLLDKTEVTPQIVYSDNELQRSISVIASQATITPVYPTAKIIQAEAVIQNGQKGTMMDNNAVAQQVLEKLTNNDTTPIVIQIQNINPVLTDQEVVFYQEYVAKFIGKSLLVSYEFTDLVLSDSDIATWIKPDHSFDQTLIAQAVAHIASLIDRDPQNSIFVFENNKVKEFTPSKSGVRVIKDELVNKIQDSAKQLPNSTDKQLALSIPVTTTDPQITNDQVNNLGINELIGRGTSTYRGSIASRVYNVSLAATRINGTLVAPGESFSFNQALGDVSQLTGYKQAYVIKEGKTVLGDGGGVCQVSTTLFRAILDAGLPITERQGHSYRVGYYEQDSSPGLDATVYGPHPDLRFTNNTSASILIQAQADSKNLSLVFELYGTSDGRVATITKPVMTNVAAPPDDLYVDDPTLPTGQIKQIEHKAWGGTAIFNYEVKDKDGNVTYTKKFITNFQPWQAVYLRGTGPTI